MNSLLNTESWKHTKNKTNGNEKFNSFHNKFVTHFENSFPLVNKTFSSKNVKYDNWKTQGLKISKKKLCLLDKLKNIDTKTYTKQYVKRYKKLYYRLVEVSKLLCNSEK